MHRDKLLASQGKGCKRHHVLPLLLNITVAFSYFNKQIFYTLLDISTYNFTYVHH